MANTSALSQGGMDKSLTDTGVSKAADHTIHWALPVAVMYYQKYNSAKEISCVLAGSGAESSIWRLMSLVWRQSRTAPLSVEALGLLLSMAGIDRLSVCFVFLQAEVSALQFLNICKKPHQSPFPSLLLYMYEYRGVFFPSQVPSMGISSCSPCKFCQHSLFTISH